MKKFRFVGCFASPNIANHLGMVSASRQCLTNLDGLMLIVFFIFLTTEIFSGLLRFCMTHAGVPWFIYFPKLLFILGIFCTALKIIYKLTIRRSLCVVLLIFAFFFCVGIFYATNWIQPFFGWWAFLPFLFAFIIEPAFYRFRNKIVPYCIVLWICAAIGVLVDYFMPVPWSGVVYQLGGVSVEGSRAWTTLGIERVAGFSRASFAVADQLLFLALPLAILERRKGTAGIFWAMTGVLIVLTTAKKTIGTYVVLSFLIIFMGTPFMSNLLKRVVTMVFPAFVLFLGFLMPVSTLFINYQLELDSVLSRLLFASFEDRLINTWPDGFSLVFDKGSMVFGRGIGGIGVAQTYFEPMNHSPADNMYLYVYATFGILLFLFFGIYGAGVCRLKINNARWPKLIWFWSIAILMCGWATNCLEDPFIGSLLGLTFSYLCRCSVNHVQK